MCVVWQLCLCIDLMKCMDQCTLKYTTYTNMKKPIAVHSRQLLCAWSGQQVCSSIHLHPPLSKSGILKRYKCFSVIGNKCHFKLPEKPKKQVSQKYLLCLKTSITKVLFFKPKNKYHQITFVFLINFSKKKAHCQVSTSLSSSSPGKGNRLQRSASLLDHWQWFCLSAQYLHI